MQQYPGRILPILFLLLLLVTEYTWSAPDSTENDAGEKTLFISYLNFDCYRDTVKGFRAGEQGYLPKRILWGQPLRDDSGRLDTTCQGRTPLRKRVKQTLFTYPNWNIRRGSVAFQRLNADSLTDIIIHIQGKIDRQGEKHDTVRSIVVFAQHFLDSVHVIPLGEVGRFQASPFFAMELVRGSDLTDQASRDLSGRFSYVLEPIDLELDEQDSTPPPPTNALAGIDNSRKDVRVYPNPAGNTITIDASGLGKGAYIIRIISVNGDEEFRHDVAVETGAGLQQVIGLEHLANGYYVVKIEDADGAVVGTWPVIITR